MSGGLLQQRSIAGVGSPTTNALATTTTPVNVSNAAAPRAGQVLKAISGSTATWQTPTPNIFDVRDYAGWYGDVVSDNSGAILLAIQDAYSAGAGLIRLPVGNFGIAQKLAINRSHIGYIGQGHGWWTTTPGATRLTWIGASGGTMAEIYPNKSYFTASFSSFTMTVSSVTYGTIEVGDLIINVGAEVSVLVVALGTGTGGVGTYILDGAYSPLGPIPASANTAVKNVRLIGNSSNGIYWDGNNLANTGLKIASGYGQYNNYFTNNLLTGCEITTPSILGTGQTKDSQYNSICHFGKENATGVTSLLITSEALTGGGGTIDANVSFNHFPQIDCWSFAGYGVRMQGDNNVFTSSRIYGLTKGLTLMGGADIYWACRHNMFQFLYANTTSAQGTEAGSPSHHNYIEWLDSSNGAADPVKGSGATCYWKRNTEAPLWR